MAFMLIVVDGRGTTSEAISASPVYGPFSSRRNAKAWWRTWEGAWEGENDRRDRLYGDDVWLQIIEIPEGPPPSPVDAAKAFADDERPDWDDEDDDDS